MQGKKQKRDARKEPQPNNNILNVPDKCFEWLRSNWDRFGSFPSVTIFLTDINNFILTKLKFKLST